MNQEIPKVAYKKDSELFLEVIDLNTLHQRFKSIKDHSPYAPHRIEFYMILLVTKHSCTHFLDFKTYELKQGDALFVAKSQVQHFNKNLEKAQGFCIIFNSEFLNKHFFLNTGRKFNRLFNYHIESPLLELNDNSFAEITEKLYAEYSAPEAFGKSEILGSFLNILLLKAERAKESLSGASISTRWLDTFSEFLELLKSDYTKNRNSRYYASSLHVSYKYLNDVVKKISGNSVKRFIDLFVIFEIKRYLITSPYSIKEISYQIGFDEPGNMIKFFKKHSGMTPLRFRETH